MEINTESPIYPLQFLKEGWNGYHASIFSEKVLDRSNQLWLKLKEMAQKCEKNLPVVNASENGSIAFTWSKHYPNKELEIWLYDEEGYYAEWMIVNNNVDSWGVSMLQNDLLVIFEKYLKL